MRRSVENGDGELNADIKSSCKNESKDNSSESDSEEGVEACSMFKSKGTPTKRSDMSGLESVTESRFAIRGFDDEKLSFRLTGGGSIMVGVTGDPEAEEDDEGELASSLDRDIEDDRVDGEVFAETEKTRSTALRLTVPFCLRDPRVSAERVMLLYRFLADRPVLPGK